MVLTLRPHVTRLPVSSLQQLASSDGCIVHCQLWCLALLVGMCAAVANAQQSVWTGSDRQLGTQVWLRHSTKNGHGKHYFGSVPGCLDTVFIIKSSS